MTSFTGINAQPRKSNKALPFDHNRQAPAEVKPMSMVASGATCEAIDIGFTGATMAMIEWPHREAHVGFRSSLNDVVINLPVNDVVRFIS
jgi:hypothetical protein